MNFSKHLFLILLVSFSFFTSCNIEPYEGEIPEQNETPSTSDLFGKWWYDSGDFTADVYFHSDGKYEQRIVLLGMAAKGTADWVWLDEENGIMKLTNFAGQGQTVSESWYRFSDVLEKTMSLEVSFDGVNYSSKVFYQDTDN